MPRNGSGEWSQPANTAAVANQTASSTAFNTLIDDIGNEITNSLSRDGQGGMRANLPMGGNKVSNMAAGTIASDAVRIDQVQKQTIAWADAGGTPDNITATYSPAITTLTDGMRLRFRATAANSTTTPTFKPGTAVDAKGIAKEYIAALAVGDIAGDGYECEVVYNVGAAAWILLNPYTTTIAAASTTVAGKVELATLPEAINGTDNERAVTPLGLATLTATATRSGLVELATNAETLTGTDTDRAITPANIASLWAEFNAGAYSAGALKTQAHSLSTYPKAFEAWLENTATDRGYTSGMRVKVSTLSNNGGGDRIPVTYMDTTNLYLAMPNNLPFLGNAAGSTEAAITASKWDVIFRIQK